MPRESAAFDAQHPLRVGLVGSGMMGFEHIRNLALHDDMQLQAFADPHPASREFGRKTASATQTDPNAAPIREYDDAAAMLASEDLDAVIVSSPNHTHAAVLDVIFEHPVHVLVEKPLATTLQDCDRLLATTRNREQLVWVGMEYRFMPPIARLIDEVRAGTAGRLRMLSIREHRFPFLKKVGDWNRFNRNTGGTLVEKCCHFFDLMNLIVGARPDRVYASGAQDVNHLDESYDGETPDILDNAFVTVDYDGGVRAMLDLCMFAEGSRNEQEICATGDLAKIECFIPESLVVIGRRENRATLAIPIAVDETILEAGFHHGSTYYQHRAFLEAIKDPQAPRIDVAAGRAAVGIGLAAQRSIETGQPIEMASFGI